MDSGLFTVYVWSDSLATLVKFPAGEMVYTIGDVVDRMLVWVEWAKKVVKVEWGWVPGPT